MKDGIVYLSAYRKDNFKELVTTFQNLPKNPFMYLKCNDIVAYKAYYTETEESIHIDYHFEHTDVCDLAKELIKDPSTNLVFYLTDIRNIKKRKFKITTDSIRRIYKNITIRAI